MGAAHGKKGGCPVKADGQVKDCPAFKVSNIRSVNILKEGCPYSKAPETEEHKEKVVSVKPLIYPNKEDEVTNCPAFKVFCKDI